MFPLEFNKVDKATDLAGLRRGKDEDEARVKTTLNYLQIFY